MTSIIKIKCMDGSIVEFEKETAEQSGTLKNLIDVASDNDCEFIPLVESFFSGPVLEKVKKYCEHHRNDKEKEIYDINFDEISEWDQEFLKNMKDRDELFNVILAADFLHIEDLMNNGCQFISDEIRGGNCDFIGNYFKILEPTETETN